MAKRRKNRKRTNKNVPATGRLRDMADRLWSIVVRDDWGGRCPVCGAWTIEAHHLIPRQFYATRHVIRNGIGLCVNCHKFDPSVSPHLNAAGWMTWLENNEPLVAQWYTESIDSGDYKNFHGIKNAKYFCDIIQGLRPDVEAMDSGDFERICGIKFSAWLQDQLDDSDESEDQS